MTLGEHVEELRGCLVRGLVAVVAAFLLALCLQDPLMEVACRPHFWAVGGFGAGTAAEGPDPEVVASLERARELGGKGSAAAALADAVERMARAGTPTGPRLVALRYTEAFMAYMKVCVIAALVVAGPFALWQFWIFVAAGLYDRERVWLRRVIPWSLGSFAAGVLFGYFVLIPIGLRYLATYAPADLVESTISLDAYLGFLLLLTVALGAVFQLPLVMFALIRSGLVEARWFAEHRRHALLAAVVVGAVLTPPDVVSQLLLAGPLILLYELGLILARLGTPAGAAAPDAGSTGDGSPPSSAASRRPAVGRRNPTEEAPS
ncbi:MAG: twin-arginine translocase subunit TatC [Planctomycetes bacterium]|nr:twin-arginine translocase subunit TatC [Planctomycetota bacterium]